MRYNTSTYIVIGFIIVLIVISSNCFNKTSDKADPRGEAYAGAGTCVQCHKEISGSFNHNAHFKTSQPVNNDSLRKYSKGIDPYIFNDSVKVDIEKRDSGYHQAVYFNGEAIFAHKFSIAFGSGEKAQTYAYWRDNSLYQLPLSYFQVIGKWANSPGFPSYPDFGRAIANRCFECHGSFIKEPITQTGQLSEVKGQDSTSIVYGIDCERCHGPAANHVNFHIENPEEKKAKFIPSYKSLTRGMKLDMCGVCHSGNDIHIQKPTFTYKPGDKLTDYYDLYYDRSPNSSDVHSKQNQVLSSSKCFIKSKMDCSSCHNTHKNDKGNLQAYSQKCITCHNQVHNSGEIDNKLGTTITNNCIDCHMPAQPSSIITYQLAGQTKANSYLLRTHKIAVYPDETQKVIQWFEENRMVSSKTSAVKN